LGYLLDTHILLWAAADHPRLAGKARAVLEEDDLVLWFSAASIWEVAIKRALDRLCCAKSVKAGLPLSPDTLIPGAL